MTTVRIGHNEINIPDSQLDGLTGARLKELANIPSDKVLIERNPNGNQVVANDSQIAPVPGQQFLQVNRFKTAGRSISRINDELRLLVAAYGNDRVHWTDELKWVRICEWPLPAGWNKAMTNVIVFYPDNYGYGAPLRDCVIDPGLRFLADGNWIEPDHYFGGKRAYMPAELQSLTQKNWRYLCVHAEAWTPNDSIFTYLELLQVFLGNPTYDWNENLARA